MRKIRYLFLTIVLTSLAPICYGEEAALRNYNQSIDNKAARAVTNVFTWPLEIPKNIINSVNDNNFVLGLIGGLFKGSIHAVARMGTGLVDLITLPLATKPIVHPVYIWDDYEVDSTYGPYFNLEEAISSEKVAMATAEQANKRAIAAELAAERAAQSATEANRKLDMMILKQIMMK